jgi:anti-sigma regulatory factor (Ser/Thr protein kinase)
MSERTYRVVVRGRFDGLDEATRARLRSEAAEHDLLTAHFTDEGTLTYDQRIDAFQHRVVVRVDEGPGEEDVARTAGELAAMEYLEAGGLGFGPLRSSATSVDDIKVRRR